MLNIYLVTQTVVDGYDTYDSFVAVAESIMEVRNFSPVGGRLSEVTGEYAYWPGLDNIDQIVVRQIGVATREQKKGVVLSSFHAG